VSDLGELLAVAEPGDGVPLMRCFDFIQWFKVDPGEDGVGPMLADLIRSAEEHAEQAHR
jgi:hypothetical protein